MRRRRGSKSLLAVLAVLVVPAAACSEDSNPFQVIEEITFFAGLGIDLNAMTKLPSGVYILDDSVGVGQLLADGDSIRMDHRGWLANGTQFSSGIFPALYPSDFIPGFSIGMEGMAEGGQRLMIIPPALGYGSNPPSAAIPSGAVLVFEVELLDVY
jgi:FKBP-type peptidyl-prolyl cis-trans isomerase FkpA